MVSEKDALEVVSRALAGQQDNDDQTLAAAELLAERLERVKKAGALFAQIDFSPQMKALLAMGRTAGAVGFAVV